MLCGVQETSAGTESKGHPSRTTGERYAFRYADTRPPGKMNSSGLISNTQSVEITRFLSLHPLPDAPRFTEDAFHLFVSGVTRYTTPLHRRRPCDGQRFLQELRTSSVRLVWRANTCSGRGTSPIRVTASNFNKAMTGSHPITN